MSCADTNAKCWNADERLDECWLVMRLPVKPMSKPQRRPLITYEANELSGWLRSSDSKRETERGVWTAGHALVKSVEREVQGEICTIAGAAAKAAELLVPTALRSVVVLGPAAVADMGVLARAETATPSVEVPADRLAIRHRTDSIEGVLVVTLRTKGTLAASGLDEAAGLTCGP